MNINYLNPEYQDLLDILKINPKESIRKLFKGINTKQKGKRIYFDEPNFNSFDYNLDSRHCKDFRDGKNYDLISLFAHFHTNDNIEQAMQKIKSILNMESKYKPIQSYGCKVEELARNKAFTVEYLLSQGMHETTENGKIMVEVPYYNSVENKEKDCPLFVKLRTSLTGNTKYIFASFPKYYSKNLIPYGAWLIEDWINTKELALLIVEGETDTLSMWLYGYACLGISGANNLCNSLINRDILELLHSFNVIYVIIENDNGGIAFLKQIADLEFSLQLKIKLLRLPDDYKDVNELHIAASKHKDNHSFFTEVIGACIANAESYKIEMDEPPIEFNTHQPKNLDPKLLPDHPFFNMVKEVATSTQTPLELAVTISLVLAATLYSKRYKLKIKKDWLVPLNLWALILLVSGGGKSPVFRHLRAPFDNYEASKIAEAQAENERRKNFNSVILKKIGKIEKNIAEDTPEDQIADQISSLKSQLRPLVQVTRYFVRNITTEALTIKLAEQKGKITIASDEGIGILENIAGRYSSGEPNDSDINSSWDGTPIHVDRVNRESVHVKQPLSSIVICIQNEKFKRLKNKRALLDSGHLFRYLTVITSQAQGDREFNAEPVPDNIAHKYDLFIREGLSKPYNYDDHGEIISKQLEFSTKAATYYPEIWNKLEGSTKKGRENEEEHMRGYIPKAKENVVKVAQILHCLLNACPEDHQVSLNVLQLAEHLNYVFIDNFKVAYELMELDIDQENALIILEWMRSNQRPFYTNQDIWQHKKKNGGRFSKMDALKKALKILKERIYIVDISNTDGKKFRLNNNLL